MCHSWGSLHSEGGRASKQLCQLLLCPWGSATMPWAAVRELPCQTRWCSRGGALTSAGRSRLHCRGLCCSQGQSSRLLSNALVGPPVAFGKGHSDQQKAATRSCSVLAATPQNPMNLPLVNSSLLVSLGQSSSTNTLEFYVALLLLSFCNST